MEASEHSFVKAERRGAVLLLLIDRPAARNALNPTVLTRLSEELDRADRDPAVHEVALTGGPKDFSAGADVDTLAGHSPASYLASPTRRAFESIFRTETPIVAGVAGFCLGGGCELALSCDLIVAGDNAIFGQPEINLGIIPGAGGTQLWRERTGAGPQVEAALTGRFVDAWSGRRMGLVDEVVPAECIVEATLEKARGIASKAPLASRTAKAALRSAGAMSLHAALSHEVGLMAGLLGTEDAREGTRAFLEKRRPNYRGH
jgi:enoyl-CoA hydratase/carnithine racemase